MWPHFPITVQPDAPRRRVNVFSSFHRNREHPDKMCTMKTARRKFAAQGPLSLLMFKGRLALWSRDESSQEHLIWLDSAEAAILLQFSVGPREPAEAATAVGMQYSSELDQLIDKLVRHRILSEHV